VKPKSQRAPIPEGVGSVSGVQVLGHSALEHHTGHSGSGLGVAVGCGSVEANTVTSTENQKVFAPVFGMQVATSVGVGVLEGLVRLQSVLRSKYLGTNAATLRQ
jgi:hypothetical protein